jgi:hypothetical protein
MPQLVPEPLDPADIVYGARWLAQAYDPGSDAMRFVAMEPDDYRAASFLDDRMFAEWRDVRLLSWPEVVEAMAGAGNYEARWIFHIGHVGSTLLARMLGELPSVLALREPRLLRDLALLPPDKREAMAPVVRALCSRQFAPGETVLVKATSFVSEIAPLLVPPAGQAIFMFAGAQAYIETILAGENSIKELYALHDYRAQRMAGRVPALAATSSEAARAAMAWACEMTALEEAARAMPDRAVLWLDFDRFLADPAQQLNCAAEHLGLDAGPTAAEQIVSGPLMRRYSKDPAYEYSPGLREELRADVRRMHGADIASAITMLEEASRQSPLLSQALERSAGRN